jgi:hypothetical protein
MLNRMLSFAAVAPLSSTQSVPKNGKKGPKGEKRRRDADAEQELFEEKNVKRMLNAAETVKMAVSDRNDGKNLKGGKKDRARRVVYSVDSL